MRFREIHETNWEQFYISSNYKTKKDHSYDPDARVKPVTKTSQTTNQINTYDVDKRIDVKN